MTSQPKTGTSSDAGTGPAPSPPSVSKKQTVPSVDGAGAPKDQFNSHGRYPNPPETRNPDAATLREQWRFAIRQYSKWYSHAWGTAALAGLSFFALGWYIKGSNPISSSRPSDGDKDGGPSDDDAVRR
ncbi:hypothetical protein QJS04_geneDACA011098 [Acorus gramineus]|uniref:Uncharacterized protein n=1 Tax=Acorus gramineus TaxID=55184 RepID=A0AAV9BI35_ACOGR|nr:hypothetical protein QJS04_geneDACA011098 [Acorus gramineus]